MMKTFAAAAGSVFLAALFAAPPSESAPITVSAGEFAVFNFDLSTATPGPPYDRALLSTARTELDFPDDVGEWLFWTELDGTGDVFAAGGANLGSIANFDELNDGVVSATLTMVSGSITVSPCLLGIPEDGPRASTGGECDSYIDPAVPVPVPEPATFALLGIGLAVTMMRRRT